MSIKNVIVNYSSVAAITIFYYLFFPSSDFKQLVIAVLIELPVVVGILFLKKFFQDRKKNG